MDLLLATCTDSVYDLVGEAHVPAPQPRISPEGTTRYGSFATVVHKLKLAYAANLKHWLQTEVLTSEGHSQSVRDLTDIIKAKLNKHCDADAVHFGLHHMKEMLKKLLEEFQWDVSAQIFEECAMRARSEKAKAYIKAKQEQDRLKQTRATGN